MIVLQIAVAVCSGKARPPLISDHADCRCDLLARKTPNSNVSQAGLLSPVSFEQLVYPFHKALASHQRHGFDFILGFARGSDATLVRARIERKTLIHYDKELDYLATRDHIKAHLKSRMPISIFIAIIAKFPKPQLRAVYLH